MHSGADLQASAKAASEQLPGAVKGYLGYVLGHAKDHIILPLMENAVEARTELNAAMTGNRRARHIHPPPTIVTCFVWTVSDCAPKTSASCCACMCDQLSELVTCSTVPMTTHAG